VTVPARGTQAISTIEVLGQFLDLNHAWRFGPPSCEVVQARWLGDDGALLGEAAHFPLGLAPLLAAPRDIGLAARVLSAGDAAARLEVATRGWAIGVHFDVPGWEPDDEHFHLAPGATRTLALRRTGERPGLAGALHALNSTASVPIETAP
jgi:beta-mannosidase